MFKIYFYEKKYFIYVKKIKKSIKIIFYIKLYIIEVG